MKSSAAGRRSSTSSISGRSANTPPPTYPPTPRPKPPKGTKNVLFVMADDLRPNLGVLHPWMRTPNLDRLANRSLIFTRAYVQQQVCSPSRNSFMTGRRPDRTQTWNFIDDFRVHRNATFNNDTGAGPGNGASWATLPGYFLTKGYNVFGSGKTYHPGRPVNNDHERSWVSYDDAFAEDVNKSCNSGRALIKAFRNGWKEIVDCEENDAETLLTMAAVRHIQWATAPANASRPFFIAMGHHRPHLPWTVPSRFFDAYGDPDNIAVAEVQHFPETAPTISWHPWFNQVFWNDTDAVPQTRRLAYYAAVSYFDSHLGLVLDALKASGAQQDTAVLLIGDHGWHLGERNFWEKKGLDELDCHIPLLVAVPWLDTASRGTVTTALAEAVDIFPTLVDLAGLPPCSGACLDGVGGTNSTPSALQGVSLMPALLSPPSSGTGDPVKGFKQYAFSQFPRCNCTYQEDAITPGSFNGTCHQAYDNPFTSENGATGAANHHVCLFTPADQFDWMGYSVRSDTRRYTLYVKWNGAALRPLWDEVWGEELYPHDKDDGRSFDGQCSEPVNLLGREVGSSHVDPNDRRDADALKAIVMQHFSNDN